MANATCGNCKATSDVQHALLPDHQDQSRVVLVLPKGWKARLDVSGAIFIACTRSDCHSWLFAQTAGAPQPVGVTEEVTLQQMLQSMMSRLTQAETRITDLERRERERAAAKTGMN